MLESMNAIDPLMHRPLHEPLSPKRYAVDAGDCLYTQADSRGAAFKIEQGAFTVFRRNIRRPSEFIETAIIGDVIGLGCSDRYADNARAIVSSIVCSLPSAQVNELAKTDPAFRLKQIDAIEREFQYRKELLVNRSRNNPIGRVAAFLLCVSCQNEHEGMDTATISEDLNCEVVSNYLGMDVTSLAEALVELAHLALIVQIPPSGLRLTDIAGLEKLSDGQI